MLLGLRPWSSFCFQKRGPDGSQSKGKEGEDGKERPFLGFVALLLAFLLMLPPSSEAKGKEGKPIIIGCPLSTAFLYGWDAERGI
ncbi:MAG: hypothetical protein DRG69_05205, partial [Deltaproteobacteria bacterium]